MSLSSEPVFSLLKNSYIVGYKNIDNARYAGASGKHRPDEPAVDTTNGAGPHNIQLFVLNADGTVLSCLPGYWHAQDLAKELELAQKLNKIWEDPSLSREQKDKLWKEMQLAHLQEHDHGLHNRSRMQGFDVQYEAKNRPGSDFFYNSRAINPATGATPDRNVKTVDIVMHERLATRPFEQYKAFDVASFFDYGKPIYDKHEQFLDASGKIAPGADLSSEPMIGNTPKAHPVKTQLQRTGKSVARTTFNQALRYGLRALIH